MSKISAFISSLRDAFTQSELKEEIGILRTSAKEVASTYRTASDLLGKTEFKSETGKNFDSAYKRYVKGSRNQNLFVGIHTHLTKLEAKLQVIEKLLQDEQKTDILREAISALEINIIRYLEQTKFVITYSSRLATVLAICETNVVSGQEELATVTQAEADYIAKHSPEFWEALNVLAPEAKVLETSMKSIPDIMLNKDNADAMASLVGRNKIDPLQMGFIPVNWNPFYHINMAIAEMQADAFDKLIEERNMVQFKLQQYKYASSGKANPALELKIQKTQERLDKLNHNLYKKVEEYGLDGSQYV